MSAAQVLALSGLPGESLRGAMQTSYGPVLDLVAGPTGTHVVIPPTPARLWLFGIAWEIKTTGGTISVAPSVQIGTNSPNFNNQFTTEAAAGFKTQAAETVLGPSAYVLPTQTSDLTSSGLIVNVTALATGSSRAE